MPKDFPFNSGDADNTAGNPFGMGATALTAWMRTSQEVARFYAQRMKRNLVTGRELAMCQSPRQFADVWTQAARDTMHDYAEEFDRIVALNRSEPETVQ